MIKIPNYLIMNLGKIRRSIYFVLSFCTIIFLNSCGSFFSYTLDQFYPLEGEWIYYNTISQNNWLVKRQILEKKKINNIVWYKVETITIKEDGKNSSSVDWYSYDQNSIRVKSSEKSEESQIILALPNTTLESDYQENNDLIRSTYEKSVYITKSDAKMIEGFSCPCLEVNSSTISTRGGSLDLSYNYRDIYAKNIGLILTIGSSGEKETILNEYKVVSLGSFF
jgi:hypothetical protein